MHCVVCLSSLCHEFMKPWMWLSLQTHVLFQISSLSPWIRLLTSFFSSMLHSSTYGDIFYISRGAWGQILNKKWGFGLTSPVCVHWKTTMIVHLLSITLISFIVGMCCVGRIGHGFVWCILDIGNNVWVEGARISAPHRNSRAFSGDLFFLFLFFFFVNARNTVWISSWVVFVD